jgi:FAD/FMN-containing dehydrogenase
VAFPTFEQGFEFARAIAERAAWQKRLVTVFEWPIPSFFAPVKQVIAEGKTLVLVMIATGQAETLRAVAEAAGGEVTFTGVFTGPRTQPLLSDYTWNHTTLWAMKANANWTYLQAGFSPANCMEQFRLLRERYGKEILFHIEFMKNGEGVVVPGAIPLVYYTTDERLNEMIAYCREIGVFIANPHVNFLEDGGRFRSDNIQLLAKKKYDPRGLLNPGKMLSFHADEVKE